MGFKKYDGSTWQSITPKKLKGIPYTGTLPVTLANTKAGYLHRYKIYGNTEQTGTPTPDNPIVPSECGERTENLFAESSITGKSSAVRSTFNTLAENIDFQSDKQYSLRIKTDTESSAGVFRVTFTYSDDTTKKTGYITKNTSSVSLTSAAGKTVKSLSITDYNAYTDITLSEITVIESSTEPEDYIPYGYKLPLTSAGQSVDIYIGDDTLSTEEYVDSGTGKIYHMVDGTLTPVDPPVPFPQIPTSAGSTTISWAGEGLAPSQFDSIQEWVDIPTYTYTNGAWVADN